MFRCTMIRRVLVHLCPAVPPAPNKMLEMAKSRFALDVTMMALLPPNSSMVRPRRFPTTSATRSPTRQDPVADIRGRRLSCSRRSPTVEPLPTTREKIAGSTLFSMQTSAAIFVTASAVNGVPEAGFHRVASPQTAAIAAFQLHTATGKLKAVITPTIPRGCHCSRMWWSGRSLAIVRP